MDIVLAGLFTAGGLAALALLVLAVGFVTISHRTINLPEEAHGRAMKTLDQFVSIFELVTRRRRSRRRPSTRRPNQDGDSDKAAETSDAQRSIQA